MRYLLRNSATSLQPAVVTVARFPCFPDCPTGKFNFGHCARRPSSINLINVVRQAAGYARIDVAATTTELPVEILAQSKAEGIPENEIHGVLGQGGAYNAVCEVWSL